VFFFLLAKFLYFSTKKLGNFDFSCVNLTNFSKLKKIAKISVLRKKKKNAACFSLHVRYL
jgi:hypothetical protein